MNPSVRVLCIFFAVFLLGLPACSGGPRTFPVRGKLTYKGKPVPNGTVLFTPVKGGMTATGEINQDGSYALTTYKPGDGAAAGEYRVVVMAMESTVGRLPEERNPLPPPIVPDKYTSLALTDLKAEVHKRDNVFDFTLVDAKPRKR